MDSVHKQSKHLMNKSVVYFPCSDSEESEAPSDVPYQHIMNLLGENDEEVDNHNEGKDMVEYGLVTNLTIEHDLVSL